jgi:hypothetical protein
MLNFRHLARLGAFEKPPRPVAIEFGISRFNAEEESVARR